MTRWYEVGFLTPFCRNHAEVTGYDHEPWRFGSYYEGIIRKYLKLRYRLLPFLYSELEEAHRTGMRCSSAAAELSERLQYAIHRR